MDDHAIDLLLILSLLTADDFLDLNFETDFDDYDDVTTTMMMMLMDLVDY
jgi:hypothetical protein